MSGSGSSGSSGSGGNGSKLQLVGGLTANEQHAKADAEMARAVELIARQAAASQVVEIVEFYFQQLPELIAKICVLNIAQAFLANGLEFNPPSDPPSVGNAAAAKPARHGGDPQAEPAPEDAV